MKVALEHGADDGIVSFSALADDFLKDGRHLFAILAAIGVGGIDHDGGSEFVFKEGVACVLDGIRVEIGTVIAPAEDEVTVRVSSGRDGGSDAFFGDSEEGLGLGSCFDGVNRGGDIT